MRSESYQNISIISEPGGGASRKKEISKVGEQARGGYEDPVVLESIVHRMGCCCPGMWGRRLQYFFLQQFEQMSMSKVF